MLVIAVLFLLSIVVSFTKPYWGIPLYLIIFFLVPYLDVSIGIIHISFNTLSIFLFIPLFYHFYIFKNSGIKISNLLPFLLLYLALFILIPFQQLSLGIQITGWFVNIVTFFILPFFISNVLRTYKNSFIYINYSILFSLLIALLYGIVVTYLDGFNPYGIYMASQNNVDLSENYYLVSLDRLFGRNASVFGSPQEFGIVLCFSFVYILSQKRSMPKYIFYILISLVIVNSLFCGVRTVIASLFFVICYLMYKFINRKYRFSFCLFVLIVVIGLVNLDSFSTFINSTLNSSSDGSSLDMRMNQLEGCFSAIDGNYIVGNGYGWHGYYRSVKGDHPIILAFESLLFIVLCDYGFLGLIFWLLFSIYYYRFVRQRFSNNSSYLVSLLFVYLSYTLITGDYGYMKYFILFYVLTYYSQKYENQSKNNCILSPSIPSNS